MWYWVVNLVPLQAQVLLTAEPFCQPWELISWSKTERERRGGGERERASVHWERGERESKRERACTGSLKSFETSKPTLRYTPPSTKATPPNSLPTVVPVREQVFRCLGSRVVLIHPSTSCLLLRWGLMVWSMVTRMILNSWSFYFYLPHVEITVFTVIIG